MSWTQIASWTYASDVPNVDFTGLAGYSDIRVLCRNVPVSSSGTRQLQVSTDNGSTYLGTSADYLAVASAGTETGSGSIGFNAASTSSAVTAEIEINAFDLATPPKLSQRMTRTDGRTTVIPTTSALNAVRVSNSAGNLTGGTIHVYGQAAPWTLVGSWTYSSNVPNVDFTGLAGYNEVRVLCRNVSASIAGARMLQVSINNGSSYLTTTGDYVAISSTGGRTNGTSMSFSTGTGTAVQSGEIVIPGFDLATLKIIQRQTRTDTRTIFIPTANALNAVRVSNSGGGNLTGGSIYVYVR